MSAVTYVVGTTGRITLNGLYALCQTCLLITDSVYWSFIAPIRGRGLRVRATIANVVEFGVNSLPIVGLICFLIGAIMAMQSSYQLARFGATRFIANLVGVAAMRELAPLMTAILITGRSGSAITAEIGTMKVAEEIDALKVMGVHPTKFLIVPKFLAMLIALPCLSLLSIFIMILGGYFLSVVVLGVESGVYIEQTMGALVFKDLMTGLVKSVFFALVVAWVGIYRGFQVEGGAEGVGKMTTSSVVTSIFLIILVDMVFTTLFYFAI